MLAYGADRSETAMVLGAFTGLGAIFLVQWAWLSMTTGRVIAIGMALRLIWLFALPALSEDAFRYLWDGHLSMQGISPYISPPVEMSDAVSPPLFDLLNSKQYFSIYPPALQALFASAAWLGGDSVMGGIIALRSLIILAELISLFLMTGLLRAWKLPERNIMLYALNPVVIVEFSGNLHAEAFMVPFLLGTLLLLHRGKWRWAGLTLAGAVATKLLPLMFLPFLPRRLGWPRTALITVMVAVLVSAMYLPFWTATLVPDTLATLSLYFANFEFNGSVYYLIRAFGFWWKGYNIIGLTAVWLPRLVALIIVLIALLDKDSRIRTLPRQWLLAWATYYFLATTVNPWYVAVLAAFLPFTRYRFALLWVLLVPLSYHAFGQHGVVENPWFIAAQYLPVYGWLALESGVLIHLQRWWALRRAQVKVQRLLPLLNEDERILEVGSGNGALTRSLRSAGHKVTPLDIGSGSIFSDVQPLVYDGESFPFKDKQFGTCQLITMLHHTQDPERLIAEAVRVADRIIIMEDVFTTAWQRKLTYLTDSLVNCEFHDHPHTNRTQQEWLDTFGRLGLKVEHFEQYRFLGLFRQVTFVLSPSYSEQKST